MTATPPPVLTQHTLFRKMHLPFTVSAACGADAENAHVRLLGQIKFDENSWDFRSIISGEAYSRNSLCSPASLIP